MTKNFAFAASIAMLMTISGQALAATAAPNAWYGSEATSPSAWQTVYAGNPFNGTAATETAQAACPYASAVPPEADANATPWPWTRCASLDEAKAQFLSNWQRCRADSTPSAQRST